MRMMIESTHCRCIATKDTTEKKLYLPLTCLSTRAVYLETTENLTTKNCITAIRRFIGRRGTPKFFSSDNATYFIVARKQLCSEPINYNATTLVETLQIHYVEWRLNPPAAPHFGGVWEGLVSIIKRAFLLNIGSDLLSRDLFATIVALTEAIFNSRPLTHVKSELDDDLPMPRAAVKLALISPKKEIRDHFNCVTTKKLGTTLSSSVLNKTYLSPRKFIT